MFQSIGRLFDFRSAASSSTWPNSKNPGAAFRPAFDHGRRGASSRRARLELEALEARTVLSTIEWTNMGNSVDDRDGFTAAFGANALQARSIVRRAIADWEDVILNFNYRDREDRFLLEVRAGSTRNIAQGNITELNDQDKPFAGNILVSNRPGTHFFDTTPDDDSEFNGWVSPFTGNSGVAGVDFYSTIVHEIGHTVGFSWGVVPGGFLGLFGSSPRLARFLTNTGIDDPMSASPGNLLTFNPDGGAIEATYTDADSGHLWEGMRDPTPAIAALPSHPNDVMNPGRALPGPTRFRITDTDAMILRMAYGYTIRNPSQVNTFHADLGSATGALTVVGDPTRATNDIRIGQSLDSSTVIVEVNGTREAFAASAVRSIVINSAGSNDTVFVMGTPAAVPVTVNPGAGVNQVSIGGLLGLASLGGDVTVNGDFGVDTVTISGSPLFGGSDLTYTLTETTLTRNAFLGVVRFFRVENVNLYAGAGHDVVHVLGSPSGTTTIALGRGNDDVYLRASSGRLVINGEAGADEIHMGNLSSSLDTIRGVVTVDGGADIDWLNYPAAMTAAVNVDLSRGTATAITGAVRGIENVRGGRGNDTLVGDAFANTLEGRDGNDWLYGGGGDDWLYGGANDDHLYGQAGLDHLFGEFGNDYLDGGHDRLRDVLRGGTGADTYVDHQNLNLIWNPIDRRFDWIWESEDFFDGFDALVDVKEVVRW
jgi:Ca2+-binding RTX toxin-like protein